jgi:protein-S-isoprenylcysteine O-methyltransferase Ste14
MVFSHVSLPGIGFDLWSLNPFILGIAVILTIVGLSFAVWAILVSFLRKLTLEENWSRSHSGTEYELYPKRVRTLIPHP